MGASANHKDSTTLAPQLVPRCEDRRCRNGEEDTLMGSCGVYIYGRAPQSDRSLSQAFLAWPGCPPSPLLIFKFSSSDAAPDRPDLSLRQKRQPHHCPPAPAARRVPSRHHRRHCDAMASETRSSTSTSTSTSLALCHSLCYPPAAVMASCLFLDLSCPHCCPHARADSHSSLAKPTTVQLHLKSQKLDKLESPACESATAPPWASLRCRASTATTIAITISTRPASVAAAVWS